MSRPRRPQSPPQRPSATLRSKQGGQPGLLELDRFSKADLEKWNTLSKDLDELHAILYAGVEPQRKRHHDELIGALQSVQFAPLDFAGWIRMVPVRYADEPLSAAGSLRGYGGRFNIGSDVDNAIRTPWPALYIASNHETAYREKFGLAKGDRVDGLSGEELALAPGSSYAAFILDGHLDLVFDIAQEGALEPVCNVLRKMKLPIEARKLQKRLRLNKAPIKMIRSAAGLLEETLAANWRGMPAQFGVPAISQILASLIIDAGYAGIRYPSTKSDGECVAVFPHRLASEKSFVALTDKVLAGTRHLRLDMNTAEALCCWDELPSHLRPRSP